MAILMDDLRLIIAGNIADLRREHGLTQLELAEKINYSDKAISKWERGESIPDIITLKAVADLFSVPVDYLLTLDHMDAKNEKRVYTHRQNRNHSIIAAMSAALVWLVATFVFVNIHLILAEPTVPWMCFVYAVPVTAIVLLIFNSIWGNRRHNFILITILLWSVLASVYLSLLSFQPWLIFIVGIPAQIIIVLWSGLKTKK